MINLISTTVCPDCKRNVSILGERCDDCIDFESFMLVQRNKTKNGRTVRDAWNRFGNEVAKIPHVPASTDFHLVTLRNKLTNDFNRLLRKAVEKGIVSGYKDL
jgi:IS4 transposase